MEQMHNRVDYGDFTIDEGRSVILFQNRELSLRPQSLHVLRLLIERSNQLVTKEEFFRAVWPDVHVTDDSLTHCITDIRKALGETHRANLKTIPRRGYMLLSRSDNQEESPSEPAIKRLQIYSVSAILLVGFVIAVLWGWRSQQSQLPSQKSLDVAKTITVLPFTYLGDDHQLSAFGVRLADNLISHLGKNSDLRVVSSRYLVEGSLAKSGEGTRVNISVIDAQRGGPVWSESYSHSMQTHEDVTELYSLVNRNVELAIKSEIAANELAAQTMPTQTLSAEKLVDQAMFNFRAGNRNVEPLVDLALTTDPNYARAHAVKGWILRNNAASRQLGDPWVLLKQAMQHFDRAIELNPDLPTSYVQKAGLIANTTGDYRTAMRLIDKAEALDQQYLHLSDKAKLLAFAGELEQALAVHEKLAAMDPLYFPLRVEVLMILEELGEYEKGITLVDNMIALTSNPTPLLYQRFFFTVNMGRFEEARNTLALLEHNVPLFVKDMSPYLDAKAGVSNDGYRAFLIKEASRDYPRVEWLVDGYWVLKEWEQHLNWMDEYFAHGIGLQMIPRSIRLKPRYWERLSEWAGSDPERQQRVNEHKSRVALVKSKMEIRKYPDT